MKTFCTRLNCKTNSHLNRGLDIHLFVILKGVFKVQIFDTMVTAGTQESVVTAQLPFKALAVAH